MRSMALSLGMIAMFHFSGCREYRETLGAETPEDLKSLEDLSYAGSFSFEAFTFTTLSVELRHLGAPYPDAPVELLDDAGGLIQSARTGSDGKARFSVRLPVESRYVRLVAKAVGVVQDTLRWDLERGTEIRWGENPQVSVGLAASDRPQTAGLGKFAARTAMEKTFDASGVPLDLAEPLVIPTGLLQDIGRALPESRKLMVSHPEYLQQGVERDLHITDSADVWITFLHEGAGYRNVLGFFAYRDGEPPASRKALKRIPIFPNTSFPGSGGNLKVGDTKHIGRFPGGTRIGFYIIADGWTGSNIDTNRTTYYSIDDFNPESKSQNRTHLATLFHPDHRMAILGFEDLNRDGTGCDHDFNDAIFTATWNPIQNSNVANFVQVPSSTDRDADGIADNNDDFPNDPSRAFVHYFPSSTGTGILAYEDLYPHQGDYDFNDVVVRYRVKEIRDATLKVKQLQAVYFPLATGAEIKNGFAVSLGKPVAEVISATLHVGSRKFTAPFLTKHPDGEIVATIANDVTNLFADPENRMINTKRSKGHYAGDSLVLDVTFATAVALADPPYNPFIFRTTNPSQETHLPDQLPTARFNRALFGTGQDRSAPSRGYYFRTLNGLPWAVHLSSSWIYPVEGRALTEAYPRFADWAQSGGTAYRDWVLFPNMQLLYPE